MPPSWPSRLLSGPTTPTGEVAQNAHAARLQSKPLPGLPSPTESTSAPSSGRTHNHNRSSSHPLPKIFSKRRGSLGWGKHDEQDEEVDSTVVPVLDGLVSESPGRKSSGKLRAEEELHKTRLCMCCGQRVRIPRDLKVFRCTHCLTINDLQPFRPGMKHADSPHAQDARLPQAQGHQDSPQMRPTLPVSVERTRAIIDHCLATYLEAKLGEKARESPRTDQSYFDHAPIRPAVIEETGRKSSDDANLRTSLEEYPEVADASSASTPDEAPSASIRTFADFDALSYHYVDNPKPSPSRNDSSSNATTAQAQRIARKPVPTPPTRKPPLPPQQQSPHPRSPIPVRGPPAHMQRQRPPGPLTPEQRVAPERYERAKRIFRPLEEYMHHNYGRFDSLNSSFSTYRPRITGRTHSESALRTPPPEPMDGSVSQANSDDFIPQIDAKTLLLGDFAENGDWWTGRLERNTSERADRRRDKNPQQRKGVNSKSPCIDWQRMDKWYDIVRTPNGPWQEKLQRLRAKPDDEPMTPDMDPRTRVDIELDLSIARDHSERALFKVTEQILRRPGRPLTEPEDIRFLLIILSNPLLYPRHVQERRLFAARRRDSRTLPPGVRRPSTSAKQARDPGQHAGILKRTFGLLASSPESCHRYMVVWFSRMPEGRFLDMVDMVSSFVSYRLSRRKTRPKSGNFMDNSGLIPDLSGSAMHTSTQLQTAAGLSGGVKNNDDKEPGNVDYTDDWQLRAAARVMAILFAANNSWVTNETRPDIPAEEVLERDSRPRSKLHGQLLPISDFYNTLLDYQDVIADFRAWEAKKDKFSFCQFPFFLSMGAKMRILEYDARRQQETKARETYFNNVISGRMQEVNFHLHVRRECVVEDSLQRISEAVGGLQGDLKKGLKVHFAGEEGVDAGGLRKEWFLMLVRDIFDPDHGLFLYDEDSHLCYFNPNSFETSDQYYMVGVLLGLAIYNSTILDVALPPFAFRKLITSAPTNPNATVTATSYKSTMTYTLDDLAEYRPRLAAGLRQLLDFDGDVESTYLWSFTAPIERYGAVTEHPLVPGGESKPVTNANRHEFVNLYVRYLLDTAVSRQFEPFKRGFYNVCAGNALSLFRAEEIELLVRGSEEERIDVDALRAVAVYENFRAPGASGEVLKASVDEVVDVVRWFWEFFSEADPPMQRKLLQFITSSDHVPATGAAGLVLRIVAGGDGTGRGEGEERRYPVARTCFNMIVLWGWRSKEQLAEMVRGAVEGSEGFGLK